MGIVTDTTRTPSGGNSINGLSRDPGSGNLGFKGASTGRSDRGESGDGFISRLLAATSGGEMQPPPPSRGAQPSFGSMRGTREGAVARSRDAPLRPSFQGHPAGWEPRTMQEPVRPSMRGIQNGTGGGLSDDEGGSPAPSTMNDPLKPTPLVQPPADTSWAYRLPLDYSELLRQLSANVGREAMPGGRGGAVRVPSVPGYGMNTPALPNPIDPSTYGQDAGEATFFTEAIGGGMTPLYAMQDNLGYSSSWDPLGINAGVKAAAAAAAKWKSGQPIPTGYKVDPANPKKLIKL